MTADPTLPETQAERAELRQSVLGLPDPGERVPGVAWPTVGLYVGTLGLFGLELAGLLLWSWSLWITVPTGAAVTFLMFSVLHESIHHAASSRSWLNDVLGHGSMPFVVAWATYPLVKFIHIEHHRNTNEPKAVDPDGWTHEGPWWQLPLRWGTLDLWYIWFYVTHLRSRPRGEVMLTAAVALAVAAAFTTLVVTGYGSELLWGYLAPQRLGIVLLAWWFDYLPHHGLTKTQREDKYQATRIRVGGEGVLTPLFVYQNYHLVHHLHPSVPFYSYVRAWRRNEEAYLDRNAAISTWFGRSLTPSEYRAWRRLTDPLEAPTSSGGSATFHPLRVSAVESLTDEAVAVTFEVPDDLVSEYHYVQGQHLTLRAVVGGQEVRRTYSLTEPVSAGKLSIAVKRINDGVFSTYVNTELGVGDILDVMTPAGGFNVELVPSQARKVVAVAVGSGITPIMSTLSTMLEVETKSAFTLVYGNRTRTSTMFAERIDRLGQAQSDRLDVHHVFSREPSEPLQGRVTPELLTELVDDLSSVDTWFLCGPEGLVTALRATLSELAPAATVVTEIFHAEAVASDIDIQVTSAVTVKLRGAQTQFSLDSTGDSVLDAALKAGIEPPYSCAGGACGTCRANVVLGRAVMDQNHVLDEKDVEDGYVLTCQAHPVTEELWVDYDG